MGTVGALPPALRHGQASDCWLSRAHLNQGRSRGAGARSCTPGSGQRSPAWCWGKTRCLATRWGTCRAWLEGRGRRIQRIGPKPFSEADCPPQANTRVAANTFWGAGRGKALGHNDFRKEKCIRRKESQLRAITWGLPLKMWRA